jgi:multisubunit Na+/H+ antiporter MnhE subunit
MRNYILVAKRLKLYYIAGTLVGTFAGMLAFDIAYKCFGATQVFNVCSPVLFFLCFFVVLALSNCKVYKSISQKNAIIKFLNFANN